MEIKLLTVWTDEAAEVGRVKEEKSKKRKSQEKEDRGARKGRKVAKHYAFQCFVALAGGLKSRLAKAAGLEPFG